MRPAAGRIGGPAPGNDRIIFQNPISGVRHGQTAQSRESYRLRGRSGRQRGHRYRSLRPAAAPQADPDGPVRRGVDRRGRLVVPRARAGGTGGCACPTDDRGAMCEMRISGRRAGFARGGRGGAALSAMWRAGVPAALGMPGVWASVSAGRAVGRAGMPAVREPLGRRRRGAARTGFAERKPAARARWERSIMYWPAGWQSDFWNREPGGARGKRHCEATAVAQRVRRNGVMQGDGFSGALPEARSAGDP